MQKDKSGSLSKAEFVEFLRASCGSEHSEEELGRFYSHISNRSLSAIDADGFSLLLKVFNRVAEGTTITSGLAIKDGHVIRRVKKGEIIEVLEGPEKEEIAGIMRIRGMAVKDGATGWVTIAGNQGTTYLEDGGNVYKVTASDTRLSRAIPKRGEDGKPIEEAPENVIRSLVKGEIFEVLEWEKEGEAPESGGSAPPLRIRGRARADGAIGWTALTGMEAV